MSRIDIWFANNVAQINNKIDEFYSISNRVSKLHNYKDPNRVQTMDGFVMDLKKEIYESYESGETVDTQAMSDDFVKPIFKHIAPIYKSTNPDEDFELLVQKWWREFDMLLTDMNLALSRILAENLSRRLLL